MPIEFYGNGAVSSGARSRKLFSHQVNMTCLPVAVAEVFSEA